MTINILNLPSNILVRIFQFVDDKSFMRLREVRKAAKNFVDFSILKTRNTIINIFDINEENGCKLSLRVESLRDFSLWKANLHYLMTKFLIAPLQSDDINRSSMTLVIRNVLQRLITDISSNDMKYFLVSLKPFIQRTTFLKLSINVPEEHIKYYSNFFTGKYICPIDICHCLPPAKLLPYFELIIKLRVESIRFCLLCDYYGYSELVYVEEVAYRIADLVKSLTIKIFFPRNWKHPQDAVSFVIEMLNRKCAKLHIIACRNHAISLAEAEKLLKIFHRSGKRVRFTANVKENEFPAFINFQIGEYNVKRTPVSHRITVEHVEFKN